MGQDNKIKKFFKRYYQIMLLVFVMLFSARQIALFAFLLYPAIVDTCMATIYNDNGKFWRARPNLATQAYQTLSALSPSSNSTQFGTPSD